MFVTSLVLAAQLAAPALPQLNAMQQGALTCSAVLALQAARGGGDPALGREFFVRSLARIMDETGADRTAVTAMVEAEARRLAGEPDALASLMPVCRTMLETSGIR